MELALASPNTALNTEGLDGLLADFTEMHTVAYCNTADETS